MDSHRVIAIIILLLVSSTLAQFPPQPDPGCSPTKTGMPSTSKSIFFESALEDYVAAKVTCTQSEPAYKEIISCYPCNLKSEKIFFDDDDEASTSIKSRILKKNSSDPIVIQSYACCSGIRDAKGNIYDSITFTCSPGLVAGTLLLDPGYKFFEGGSLKEEDYWSLVTQSITPANQSHTTYVKETYGVQQSQAYFLSDSNGVRTTNSWNSNFGSYTNEMSSRLTEAYFHSTEIDMSASITQAYPFKEMNVTQVDSVYQLIQHYETNLPKDAHDELDHENKSYKNQCDHGVGSCYQVSYSSPYSYQARTFLQLIGVDSSPNCKDI